MTASDLSSILQILEKYEPDGEITCEYDELFVYVTGDVAPGIATRLNELGAVWDDQFKCWCVHL